MSPILTIPQIPRQFYRERRWLQRWMLPLVSISSTLTIGSVIGAFFYTPLWVYAVLLGFLTLIIMLCWRTVLRRSNTVEFYDDFLLLRNYRGELIREISYEKVLRADAVILRFSHPGSRADMRVQGRYTCLWLTETPPLSEDDAFLELAKWDELFLFASDENAETFLREKIPLLPQRPV